MDALTVVSDVAPADVTYLRQAKGSSLCKKGGQEGFLYKIPLNPPFSKGETLRLT